MDASTKKQKCVPLKNRTTIPRTSNPQTSHPLTTLSRNYTVNLSYFMRLHSKFGSGSSVGIANDYELDGSLSNPGGGRDFPPVQTGSGAHPVSCIMGTGSFRGVKCGRGVLLTTHPLLMLQSWKSRAITLHTLWATPGL